MTQYQTASQFLGCVQVQQLTLAALFASVPMLASSLLALPLAVTAAGITHVTLASMTKRLLVGVIQPGTHRCGLWWFEVSAACTIVQQSAFNRLSNYSHLQ